MLKRVENSILWLLRFPPEGEQKLLEEARKQGVRDDQIVFSDVVNREEHIKRGFLADLFLDTTVCNAHTVATDTLWTGTPMITMKGNKMASRVGASILRAAGLETELVVESLADYEELGVSLADDSDRLYQMRQHLENTRRSSAAFDTKRWVKNFEQGLHRVWKIVDAGMPPDHITVEDTDPVFDANSSDLLR